VRAEYIDREDRPSVGDLLDDVACEIISFLLQVVIVVKAVVAISFREESMKPSGAFLRSLDVTEIIGARIRPTDTAPFFRLHLALTRRFKQRTSHDY
jgi:hypothetical protein